MKINNSSKLEIQPELRAINEISQELKEDQVKHIIGNETAIEDFI